MQRHTHFILPCLLGILLLLAACATHPLNISDTEWERLTPEQQLSARKQQAVIDQENAIRRANERKELEARKLEQARLQQERDIADGMIRQYSTICIGGERCPSGSKSTHIYGLNQFAFVDKVVFTAHDNIGNKHNATIAIYADRQLVADNIDIKRHGSTQTVFIGAIARNIIVQIRNDDEVKIEDFKVFGEELDSGDVHILLQRQRSHSKTKHLNQ